MQPLGSMPPISLSPDPSGGGKPQPRRVDLTKIFNAPGRLDYGRSLVDEARYRTETLDRLAANPRLAHVVSLVRALEPCGSQHLSSEYEINKIAEKFENPRAANRDFRLAVFKKRGWLTNEEAEAISKLDLDQAGIALNTKLVEKAMLRSTDLARLPLPNPGEALGDYIRAEMLKLGYPLEKLLVRYLVNPDYARNAINSGNDRTCDSCVMHHGDYDGERLAMIQAGVVNAADTTYIAGLKHWQSSSKSSRSVVLVYSADMLEAVGPSGYPRSNGFNVFLTSDAELKKRGLLAVFER